jgi:electron transfer flavoprotein beta subunit
MKILVCISNVPDTTTRITFKDNNTALDTSGIQWIINPWDELALTRAMELKEKSGKVDKVTVITVGDKTVESTLRKALAIGADEAVRIDTIPKDAFSVADEMARYLKDHPFDIILAGIESSDYNSSAVGGMLAELLDMASVSSVSSLNFEDDEIVLTREIEGGKETLSHPVPFVAVVQKGIALDPRIPAMRGIMMARKKPLEVVPAAGTDALVTYDSYQLPEPKGACKMYGVDETAKLLEDLDKKASIF